MYNATRLAKTDPAHRQELLGARTVTGCALTLLILWTLLGNFTVCAAVIRYRHLRTKVTNIFIVSLALSDLLVAVLVMPWKAVAEVTGFWPFGAFCDTWVACDIMCSTASILNLCIISLDRYWAISSPFRYMRKMNNKVAYVMIGVTWTVSVVISFVPVQLHWHRAEIDDLTGELAGYNITHPSGDTAVGINCNSSLNRTYAISSSLISFYIPVAIMVVTYTRIYRIAQVHIRRISSQERAVEHAQSCRSDAHALAPHRFPKSHEQHHNPNHHHHYQQNNHHYNNHHLHHYNSQRALRTSIRKETKVLKTLSVIMGAFICCWFPFFVLNCAVPFCPGPESPDTGKGPLCVSEKTFDVFVWIGWSNSSLNPIIYAFNADFRDAFLRLLGCRRGERWSVMSTAVETMVASNEAGSHTQDRSLSTDMGVAYVSGVATNTVRVSEDDGDTVIRTLPLFHRRDTITDHVCDNEDCKTDGDLGLKCVDTHPLTIIN